jgi:hypothetical protein
MEKKTDIWGKICLRADVERAEGEEGYPVSVPQTFSYDWFNFRRDLVKFEIGKTSPLLANQKIVAIFEDDMCARIYAVPETKSQEQNENFPCRWTVQKTAPTSSYTCFLDIDTFFDALAADLIGYAAEFEEVIEEPEEGQPQANVQAPQAPMAPSPIT